MTELFIPKACRSVEKKLGKKEKKGSDDVCIMIWCFVNPYTSNIAELKPISQSSYIFPYCEKYFALY